ncbi:SET and MYND domain-containing protein 4-like [Mytilus trossulus]|uniref:SET and MYND domain-containing protein 4-like n=1 Tax=Mytilus trossulus TaxID=6551 RepID=UPI003005E74B
MSVVQKLQDELTKTLKQDGIYDEVLTKFKDCKTNKSRIQMVAQIDGVNKHFDIIPDTKQKSSDTSIRRRNEGNTFFQKGEFQRALDKYNQSVVNAPALRSEDHSKDEHKGDNLELSYALANRSAVFFHQKSYDDCLSDIDLAIQNEYPKSLIYKLHERKAKCYFEKKEIPKATESFQNALNSLSDAELDEKKSINIKNSVERSIEKCKKSVSSNDGKPGPKSFQKFHGPLPTIEKRSKIFASAFDAVGITENEETEFGLTATRDIYVGEVLIIEKGYTSIVLPKYDTIYCHHCCQRVVSAHPCHQCSEVMFCSGTCHKESWEEYHSLECPCLGTVKQANIGLGYLAFKMVVKAGLSSVMEYESQEQEDGCKRSVGFNTDGVYNSDDYNTVYSLVNHSEKRTPEDLFKRTLQAYFLLKCLEKTSYFNIDERKVSFADKCYVAGHMLRHIMMLPCNAHEVSELALKPECLPESETKEIGSGIYPILSLINHSCDPNVVRHSYGDVCVVRAIKNIDAGEEIADNYGALYPLTVCSERREILKPQYYFTCNCKACREDWPLYFNIPVDVPKFRCQKCNGPVVIPPDRKTENSVCLNCSHVQDTTNVIVKLHQSQDEYQNVLQQVLTGERLHEALPRLEAYLQFLYKTVCIPWQDCNNCQEAIKQCYAVQASCFIAS